MAGPNAPLGILTVAYNAHLNNAEAFPGLSLFDDEILSTEPEGRLSARVGHTTVVLGGSTIATLHLVVDGTHLDLARGVVLLTRRREVSAKCMSRAPFCKQRTPGECRQKSRFLGRRFCRSLRGGETLVFLYRDEQRVLPEGETYRIRLGV